MASSSAHSVKDDRETYIGGSDAASVLNLSPWRSSYRTWCEKVGIETPPNLDEVEFVYFGNVLEPIVASEFERRCSKAVQNSRRLYRHAKHPYIAGHLDRLVLRERAFLECKVSNAFDYKKWGPSESGRDGVPEHYQVQCDHYMMLRDCTHCYVAVLIGGNQFRWYRLERLEASKESRLLDAEVEFWRRVKNNDPPPILNEADARHRWQSLVAGSSVAISDDDRKQLVKLANITAKRKELDREEKELRNWLFPLFQDKEAVSNKGEVLARLSAYSTSRFDLDAFRLKHAKLAARFTKPVPAKRLKIVI